MGVHVEGGTITIRVSDLHLEDSGISDEDDARNELSSVVESAISGACETYRHALSLESIELFGVEGTAKVAEVKLTASVTMKVAYDESDGDPSPEDWAADYGWNFLVFEAHDADFDYSVEDDDTGDDPDEADWSSTTDSVPSRTDTLQRQQQNLRDQLDSATQSESRLAALQRRITAAVIDTASPEWSEGKAWRAVYGLLDTDFAHGEALADRRQADSLHHTHGLASWDHKHEDGDASPLGDNYHRHEA